MSDRTHGGVQRGLVLALAALLTLTAAAVVERPTVTFYVSPTGDDAADGSMGRPVKTIERAVELTRGLKSEAKRAIVVADGFYRLEKTITLGDQDVDLTIRAAHRGKAVLSGASEVSGWTRDAQDARFLTAKLPFETKPNVLYAFVVGDSMAELASFPEFMGHRNIRCPATLGDGTNFHSLPYDPKSFPAGFDAAGIDLASAWVIVPQEWASTRSYIATNDVANSRFILKSKTNMPIGKYNAGFKLMNVRIGLRHPGMWMFEQTEGRIVYWPREGETAENLRCSVARLGCLMAIHGATGVTVDGFAMEGCLCPSGGKAYGSDPFKAVISVKHGKRIAVRHCALRNSAGSGIAFLKADRAEVTDCEIHDVGANGIQFVDGGAGHCKVLRNHVWRNGQLTPTATCIYMQVSPIECVGNKVHDAPGSGLILWGKFSVVASNDISNVMLVRRDGGGLYGGYDYTVVKDNYVHYTVKNEWPGLYADEGSQHSVFTGNVIEGLAWPTHMHQTWGIVVTNNVFRNDSPMRWTFQGGTHSVFADNKIYTTRDITNDNYVANCGEWARNEVFVKDGDGYRSVGLRGFKATPRPAPGPYEVPRPVVKDGVTKTPKIDGKSSGEYDIPWRQVRMFPFLADGMPEPTGEPGNYLRPCCDGTYLYLQISQKYPMLTPYPGIMNLNPVWGHGDAIRIYLGEKLEITAYWDGTVESNDPTLDLGPENFALDKGGWWSGKGMEMRIPCARLGIAPGKTIAFNAQSYNRDHDMYRWMFPIKGGDVRTGALAFPAEAVEEKTPADKGPADESEADKAAVEVKR